MNNSFARRALVALLISAGALAYAQEKETVRPEVGKPLQAAQELLKAQKPKEALGEINKADAVANKTAFESYLVERMRASAAAGAGDVPLAIKAFEAVIASGRLAPAEQLTMIQALAGSYYRNKDYPKAIAWGGRYFKEGGTDPQLRLMLIHSYYLNGEFDAAAQEALADIQADEMAGKAPPEDRLQLLANAYLKQNDANRYAWALEKLVTYYPKKEYWADLIVRTQKKMTFAERLALDVLRLRLATDNLEGPEEYMEMAQLALQAGYPAEARKVIEQGYANGVLGKGAVADRHKRMRDLVEKQAADDRKSLAKGDSDAAALADKDGISLVNLGFAYVTDGQFDKGLALMERGIARGIADARRPQDAKLHLGVAYFMAGRKDKALEIFPTVTGIHGAADMGRLWTLRARQL
jgi:outer membrane protein assembly factor BamD (BamD/ComL family)